MTDKPDGGPAFPVTYSQAYDTFHGMSLRDYFAGQALAGLAGKITKESDATGIGIAAYNLADRLLAKRGKQ